MGMHAGGCVGRGVLLASAFAEVVDIKEDGDVGQHRLQPILDETHPRLVATAPRVAQKEVEVADRPRAHLGQAARARAQPMAVAPPVFARTGALLASFYCAGRASAWAASRWPSDR